MLLYMWQECMDERLRVFSVCVGMAGPRGTFVVIEMRPGHKRCVRIEPSGWQAWHKTSGRVRAVAANADMLRDLLGTVPDLLGGVIRMAARLLPGAGDLGQSGTVRHQGLAASWPRRPRCCSGPAGSEDRAPWRRSSAQAVGRPVPYPPRARMMPPVRARSHLPPCAPARVQKAKPKGATGRTEAADTEDRDPDADLPSRLASLRSGAIMGDDHRQLGA